MLERLVVLGVRYLLRGQNRYRFVGQPWLYTTAALLVLRLVRRVGGRRPVTESLTVKPGQSFLVEGMTVSHRDQIRESKRARRADRRKRRNS